MAYTQAGIAVENQQVFGELKTAVDAVFASQAIGKFLRSMERSGLRIRDFAGVLQKGLLPQANAAQLFLDFARKPGKIRVREAAGDRPRFGFAESMDLPFLLGDVACVFRFRFQSGEQSANGLLSEALYYPRPDFLDTRLGTLEPLAVTVLLQS